MPRGQKAGQAIAAGGYGCVFKPPLKCKDPSVYYDPTGVSKLMMVEDANDEMNEVRRIQPIVNSIPNNENYFLELFLLQICEAFSEHFCQVLKAYWYLLALFFIQYNF